MIIFILTLAGTALLCVSMPKHWQQILPGRGYARQPAMALRALAYLVLLGAMILASRSHGVGVGITIFFGMLSVATLGIAVALPYWRRR
ncbi:MAG: DUF3325 family protein [Acidobacteriota bacterium]